MTAHLDTTNSTMSAPSKETIIATIKENWLNGLDDKGQFRLAILKVKNHAAYAMLATANSTYNSNYVSGLIYFLKKEGALPKQNVTVSPTIFDRVDHAIAESAHRPAPATEDRSERVRWTDTEIDALATEWVSQRLEYPLHAQGQLIQDSEDAVFAQTPDRKRKLVGLSAHPALMKAVSEKWNAAKAKIAAPVEEKVTILTVEVPRHLTFDEMLNLMDEPSMQALLVAKQMQRENITHMLLREIAANVGAQNVPKVMPFVPNATIYEQSKPKQKRIVIIGPLKSQFDEIEQGAKAAGLTLDLRFVDKDMSHMHLPYCDYVITTKHSSHDADEMSIAHVGRDRVFHVDGGGIGTIVQKLRDISSRK
jgi:hypothetical protein